MLAVLETKDIEQWVILLVVAGLIALIYYRKPWRPRYTEHGTARWATEGDLKERGMLDGATKRRGLLLGRTFSGKPIWLREYTHLGVFAPTSAGKGVSLLRPWLMTWNRGSLIVNDPKGELFNGHADARRKMGQKVARLDPFGVCGPGADMFNPLDLIPTGEACIPHCRAMAAAMVVRGEEKEQHWNDRCTDILTSVLCFVCTAMRPEDRSLATVRAILSQPSMFAGCAVALQQMGGLFSNLAGSMLSLEDKEKAGVISTCHRHTNSFDDPAILPAVVSGWDARELLDGNVALFIILPGWAMESQVRWIRIVIASALRLVGQQGMKGGKELLMLLDEAALLGHMQPLEQGLALLRSSGLRMAFFFQSLGQLKEAFKEKESVLLDNVQQIYFGVQSLETAQRVNQMLGPYTATAESFSENDGTSRQVGGFGENQGVNYSHSRNLSVSVHSRDLLQPAEVLTLPGSVLIAFLRGVPPVLCKRVLYYSDPLFTGRRGLMHWLKVALVAVLLPLALYEMFDPTLVKEVVKYVKSATTPEQRPSQVPWTDPGPWPGGG